MADRNEQGHEPDRYRPFDDPHHPSWYTDAGARPQRAPVPGSGPVSQNPYADQPLAGPPATGHPGYPLHGGHPGVADGSGLRGTGGAAAGWSAGVPYPDGGRRSTALGLTAMVLGIAGIATFGALMIPQLLAIVFGHLSLGKEPDARGFAVAGLIMGYLVSGLWVLLILGLAAFASILP